MNLLQQARVTEVDLGVLPADVSYDGCVGLCSLSTEPRQACRLVGTEHVELIASQGLTKGDEGGKMQGLVRARVCVRVYVCIGIYQVYVDVCVCIDVCPYTQVCVHIHICKLVYF